MSARRKPVAPKTAAGIELPAQPDSVIHAQAFVMKSSWLRDAAERILATFAQAFLGVFGATQIIDAGSGHLDVSVARMALAAGIAAVLALVKSVLAKYVAGTVSPASLAPTPAPIPVDDAEAGHGDVVQIVWLIVGLVVVLILLRVFGVI